MAKPRTIFAGLVVVMAIVSIYASTEVKKTPWKLTGQLEEACSCSSACPCWFGSKPTKMMCSGSQFIFISKGTYGNVKLDGLSVGAMAQSPAPVRSSPRAKRAVSARRSFTETLLVAASSAA